jgi:hypothetical protein
MKVHAFRCEGPFLFATGELLARYRAARRRPLSRSRFALTGGGLPTLATYFPHVPRGSLIDIRGHQIPVPRDPLR